MAAKRDYYEVLGVAKDATLADIKKAYRAMAVKYHPDKWTNASEQEKKDAENKFIEATDAYEVLKDPDKRAKYDKFGFAAFEGAAGGPGGAGFSYDYADLNDVLGDLFGSFFGGGRGGFRGFSGGFGGGSYGGQRSTKGQNIKTRVELTLEEIATGCSREIKIERNVPCDECGGKGAKNASDIQTCPACHGQGFVTTSAFFGLGVQQSTCQQCGGRGKIVKNPCHKCHGTGVDRRKVTVPVTIPAGVEDGQMLRVPGSGHASTQGGENGDLILVVVEKPHENYRRQGADLLYKQVISPIDAMLGTTVQIPLLDGTTYECKIPAGTQSGEFLQIREKGLPRGGYGGYGTLYIQVLVWIPKSFTSQEKDMLMKLRDSKSFDSQQVKKDKSLWSKLKEMFN